MCKQLACLRHSTMVSSAHNQMNEVKFPMEGGGGSVLNKCVYGIE